MKRACFVLWVLLFQLALNGHTTSILIVARHGEILVGADGKSSGSGTRDTVPEPHCKINQYGAVLVAHAGGALIVLSDNTSRPVAFFDIAPIVNRAMATPGGIEAKASALDARFWRVYSGVVHRVASYAPSTVRDGFIKQLFLEEFALVGLGENGKPKAIVLIYSNDFRTGSNPTRRRIDDFPASEPDALTLGYSEAFRTLNFKSFSVSVNDIPTLIRSYLAMESSLHPDEVLTPYTIVKVSDSGISVIESGSCRYKTGNSQKNKSHP